MKCPFKYRQCLDCGYFATDPPDCTYDSKPKMETFIFR